MKLRYIHWTGLSLLVLSAGFSGIYLKEAPVIGALLITSYLLYMKGVKSARMQGKTDRSKILHALTGNLIEFSGITAAFFFTEAWAVVLALAAVGLLESFFQELGRRNLGHSMMFGRLERITVLGLSFLGVFFNEYVLLYGLIIVGGMALFEGVRQLLLFFRD